MLFRKPKLPDNITRWIKLMQITGGLVDDHGYQPFLVGCNIKQRQGPPTVSIGDIPAPDYIFNTVTGQFFLHNYTVIPNEDFAALQEDNATMKRLLKDCKKIMRESPSFSGTPMHTALHDRIIHALKTSGK